MTIYAQKVLRTCLCYTFLSCHTWTKKFTMLFTWSNPLLDINFNFSPWIIKLISGNFVLLWELSEAWCWFVSWIPTKVSFRKFGIVRIITLFRSITYFCGTNNSPQNIPHIQTYWMWEIFMIILWNIVNLIEHCYVFE